MTQSGPLELAYLGDAVWELYVRNRQLEKSGRVKDLHRQAVSHVRAGAQAASLRRISEMLTEEEQAVVRRARNAHQTPTKNADIAEYHMATAFEALLGWLYLEGRNGRLDQLMAAAYDEEESHTPNGGNSL